MVSTSYSEQNDIRKCSMAGGRTLLTKGISLVKRLAQRLVSRNRRPSAPAWRTLSWQPDTPPLCLEVDKRHAAKLAIQMQRIIGVRAYSLDELCLMVAAFWFHAPQVVIDIGTHVGRSARVFWELKHCFDTSTQIHTIDICDPSHPEYPGPNLGRYIRRTDVVQHIGDSSVVGREIISSRPNARYLLFVDGDHEYPSVCRDLSLLELVAPGSCALVHDTFYQPGSGYNHGPYEAVCQFVAEHEVQQVVHLQTGLPGMSYICI